MRLFATLTPPASIRAALLATMHGIDGARWQAEEQLHLTLRFCGEVAESDVPLLAAELRRVAFAPFPLCIAGVGHFEKKNRVHTVWAGVEAGEELFALQRRIESGLSACRSWRRRGAALYPAYHFGTGEPAGRGGGSVPVRPCVALHARMAGGRLCAL
ncbi:MAG: RNA 2',3'-cyclic phosphodiesterase [Sphingomonadaceae bacterium]